jgi:hypothetical protein
MSGVLGFGQSGEESSSIGNVNSIFNYGLPTAQQGQASGTAALGNASSYYDSLLTAGRTQAAQSAAPAINATLAQSDASKRQQSTSGTGRTGGTAELNAESGAATSATIDNIINQTMQTGKATGAAGETQVGTTELSNAIANLGIASGGQQALYGGAVSKEGAQGGDLMSILSALI